MEQNVLQLQRFKVQNSRTPVDAAGAAGPSSSNAGPSSSNAGASSSNAGPSSSAGPVRIGAGAGLLGVGAAGEDGLPVADEGLLDMDGNTLLRFFDV